MRYGVDLRSSAFRLATYDSELDDTRFTGVDLVPEALEKAKEKFILLARAHPNLVKVRDSWIARDMEPDALAPLRRLLESPDLGVGYLRDRIKGLRSDTVHRLTQLPGDRLADILRGCRIGKKEREDLDKVLGVSDILCLEDINRSSRFLKGDLDEEDLKESRRQGIGRINRERQKQLRSSDLSLAVLDFGDWDIGGRLPFPEAAFDAISASLFLSYLFARIPP